MNISTLEKAIKGLGPMDGIYVIYDSNYEPIFASKSKDIKEELLRHLNKKTIESECIFKNNPTYFRGGFWLSADNIEDIIKKIKHRCN